MICHTARFIARLRLSLKIQDCETQDQNCDLTTTDSDNSAHPRRFLRLEVVRP